MPERVEHPPVAREESDVNVRAILMFGIGLLLAGVVIHALLWVLFGYFSREAARAPRAFPLAAEQAQRLPPEPRLQTNPRDDLRQFRAREDATLNSYGWVDRHAGIAHIPIDEAMKIIVQRGLPSR